MNEQKIDQLIAAIQSQTTIKREELFAAAALGGLLARYGNFIDLEGKEQFDEWARLAWKYADALDEKFDDEKNKD